MPRRKHATDYVDVPTETLCNRPMRLNPKIDNTDPTCKVCLRIIEKRSAEYYASGGK